MHKYVVIATNEDMDTRVIKCTDKKDVRNTILIFLSGGFEALDIEVYAVEPVEWNISVMEAD